MEGPSPVIKGGSSRRSFSLRTDGIQTTSASSLMASAAMSGAPLASRNDVLSVLPSPLPEEDLARRLKAADAAAFIKVGRHFDKVLRLLDAEGMADDALYIQHATMEKQMILPLRDAR